MILDAKPQNYFLGAIVSPISRSGNPTNLVGNTGCNNKEDRTEGFTRVANRMLPFLNHRVGFSWITTN